MGISTIIGLNLINLAAQGKPEAAKKKAKEPLKATVYTTNTPPALFDEQSQIDYYFAILSTKDEKAVLALTDIYLSTKSTNLLLNLALLLYTKGYYQLSRMILEKVQEKLEQEKESDEKNFKLAQTYERLGLYDKAIACYNKIITKSTNELNQKYAELSLASLYQSLFMYEEALKLCSTMDQLDIQVTLLQYQCLIGLNQSKDAAKLLNQSLQIIQLKQTKYSEPNDALAYAQLLIAAGKYEEAEQILSPLAYDQNLFYSAVTLLSDIYFVQNKPDKLEWLIQICADQNAPKEFWIIQANLELLRLINIDPADNEALEKQNTVLEIRAKQCLEVFYKEAAVFPNALVNFNMVSWHLHYFGYMSIKEISKLQKTVPQQTKRLEAAFSQLAFIMSLHKAAASKKPQTYQGYKFEYLPLQSFGISIEPNSDQDFIDIMKTNITPSTPKYFTENPDKLLKLLQQQTRKPLSELNINEAIFLCAYVAEELVKSYGDGAKADTNNLPLEEKIAKGHFNQAVCRHYTAIFISLFNLVKENNPNLAAFFTFADLSPIHTFPTICTSQEKSVLCTSIDPTADDSTPAFFADKLVAEPSIHFQRDEYVQDLLAKKEYEEAKEVLLANIKSAKLDNDLISMYFTLFHVFELSNASQEEYDGLRVSLAQVSMVLPEDDAKQKYLYLLGGKCFVKLGQYQKALGILSIDKDLPKDFVASFTTTLIEAQVGLRLFAAIDNLKKQYIVFYAKIRKGFAQSPLIPYLEDGTEVTIKIDDTHGYKGVVLGGKLALPSNISPFSEQGLEGTQIKIILNPPSQTHLPNEEKVPPDQAD